MVHEEKNILVDASIGMLTVYKDFTKQKMLYLSNKQINQIDIHAFSDLIYLENLDLISN
jgi:hypothetical protein